MILQLDSLQYFIFHTINLTDLHSSPAPLFKTFKAFLICFPKCPIFSTIESYAPEVAYGGVYACIAVDVSRYGH